MERSGTFSVLNSGRVLPDKIPESEVEKANREYEEFVKTKNELERRIKWLEAEREKKLAQVEKRRVRAFSKYDIFKLDVQVSEIEKEYKARIQRTYREIRRNHARYMEQKASSP